MKISKYPVLQEMLKLYVCADFILPLIRNRPT